MYASYDSIRDTLDYDFSQEKNFSYEELAIINVLMSNLVATQKQIADSTGKSERTIKRRAVEMQKKGLICRENGKRNGKWKVLVEL